MFSSNASGICGLLAIAIGIFSGQSPEKNRNNEEKKGEEDRRVVMKLKDAIEKNVSIDKIEVFIKKKALINTFRKGDDDTWRIVKIELDVKQSQVTTLRGIKHAVYWMRDLKPNEWQIVGIVWTEKKEMKLFFGVVLEP